MGRLVNDLKTFVLLAVLGSILVAVGDLPGGTTGAAVGLLLGLAVAGYSYCFSDRTALRSAHARPLSGAEAPQLYRIIEELASDAGILMPRVCVTTDVQPNAFATGRNERHAAVAVTAGILDVLETEELRGCWPMSSPTCATTTS
jgi:heat shock protein HtpX